MLFPISLANDTLRSEERIKHNIQSLKQIFLLSTESEITIIWHLNQKIVLCFTICFCQIDNHSNCNNDIKKIISVKDSKGWCISHYRNNKKRLIITADISNAVNLRQIYLWWWSITFSYALYMKENIFKYYQKSNWDKCSSGRHICYWECLLSPQKVGKKS